jgi:hypothetical protein
VLPYSRLTKEGLTTVVVARSAVSLAGFAGRFKSSLVVDTSMKGVLLVKTFVLTIFVESVAELEADLVLCLKVFGR